QYRTRRTRDELNRVIALGDGLEGHGHQLHGEHEYRTDFEERFAARGLQHAVRDHATSVALGPLRFGHGHRPDSAVYLQRQHRRAIEEFSGRAQFGRQRRYAGGDRYQYGRYRALYRGPEARRGIVFLDRWHGRAYLDPGVPEQQRERHADWCRNWHK